MHLRIGVSKWFSKSQFFLSQKITFHAVVKSQLHSVQHHVLLYFLANSWTLFDSFALYFISNTAATTNYEICMKPTTLFRLKSTSTLRACCNISISVLWQNENCLVFSWFDNIFRTALTEYKHLASYWIEICISYLKVKICLLHHFSLYLLCPAFDSGCIFNFCNCWDFSEYVLLTAVSRQLTVWRNWDTECLIMVLQFVLAKNWFFTFCVGQCKNAVISKYCLDNLKNKSSNSYSTSHQNWLV